jgi:hypothetical protein
MLLIEEFISFFDRPGMAASICTKVIALSSAQHYHLLRTFFREAMTLLYTFCSVLESVADMAAGVDFW